MFDTKTENNMLVRKDYEDKLKKYYDNPKIRIVNIYGESGLGKTVLAQQFCESHKSSLNIGNFDFDQYAGLSDQVMIDGLYDLASTILRNNIAENLNKFNVADAVSSKRDGRIPLAQRRLDSGLDFIMQMDEIVEGFLTIPYLGTGLKTAKAARSMVQYCLSVFGKNKDLYKQYAEMSDTELNKALPDALADDLNDIPKKNQSRSIIVVDNYDKSRAGDWFKQLVNNTNTIIWIVLSEKRIDRNLTETGYIHVKKLTQTDMDHYLQDNCGINVKETRENIITLSNGSIFIMGQSFFLCDSSAADPAA